jgi:hypothetical protein
MFKLDRGFKPLLRGWRKKVQKMFETYSEGKYLWKADKLIE